MGENKMIKNGKPSTGEDIIIFLVLFGLSLFFLYLIVEGITRFAKFMKKKTFGTKILIILGIIGFFCLICYIYLLFYPLPPEHD